MASEASETLADILGLRQAKWSTAACAGYYLLCAQLQGRTEEEISATLVNLSHCFDRYTVSEAKQAFERY